MLVFNEISQIDLTLLWLLVVDASSRVIWWFLFSGPRNARLNKVTDDLKFSVLESMTKLEDIWQEIGIKDDQKVERNQSVQQYIQGMFWDCWYHSLFIGKFWFYKFDKVWFLEVFETSITIELCIEFSQNLWNSKLALKNWEFLSKD